MQFTVCFNSLIIYFIKKKKRKKIKFKIATSNGAVYLLQLYTLRKNDL